MAHYEGNTCRKMIVFDTVEDRLRCFLSFDEAQSENEAFIISGELICPRAGSHGTTKRLI